MYAYIERFGLTTHGLLEGGLEPSEKPVCNGLVIDSFTYAQKEKK